MTACSFASNKWPHWAAPGQLRGPGVGRAPRRRSAPSTSTTTPWSTGWSTSSEPALRTSLSPQHRPGVPLARRLSPVPPRPRRPDRPGRSRRRPSGCPRVALAGASYRGSGMPACIVSGAGRPGWCGEPGRPLAQVGLDRAAAAAPAGAGGTGRPPGQPPVAPSGKARARRHPRTSTEASPRSETATATTASPRPRASPGLTFDWPPAPRRRGAASTGQAPGSSRLSLAERLAHADTSTTPGSVSPRNSPALGPYP